MNLQGAGMRLPIALFALTMATDALAGGLGVVATTSLHTETVYFYDGSTSPDPSQLQMNQTLPSYGTGLEFVLGDKDDRIVGIFRGYWMQDAAQRDPASLTKTVDPDDVIANYRDTPRNIGMGTVGLQIGFLGRPESFQATANAQIRYRVPHHRSLRVPTGRDRSRGSLSTSLGISSCTAT